jgi:hypothetical protein
VYPAPPAVFELALRLRSLRMDRWPDSKLTQGALAKALGSGEPLSPATVASWESQKTPKLPPRERIQAYAQFFATRRSLGPEPALVDVDDFTAEERTAYKALQDELLGLHAAVRGITAPEPVVVRRSWRFTDDGPLTLVCAGLPDKETSPLANPAHANYTELLNYADLDAMVELWGHARAGNPPMDVFYKLASDVRADDLSGHVVIIGGVAWNDITQRLIELTQLPVAQRDYPGLITGDIFVTKTDGKIQEYIPKWSATEPRKLIEDVGLFVRMPNPMNSNRTLTMCNGIHSRGVLGAVRSLTDKRLRESNEQYIAQNIPGNQFGILMKVRVIEGQAMTPDFSIAGTVLYQWSDEA